MLIRENFAAIASPLFWGHPVYNSSLVPSVLYIELVYIIITFLLNVIGFKIIEEIKFGQRQSQTPFLSAFWV